MRLYREQKRVRLLSKILPAQAMWLSLWETEIIGTQLQRGKMQH